MARTKLFKYHPKEVRDKLREAIAIADQILELEKNLVEVLAEIDGKRFYTRVGIKSLRGFCRQALRLNRTRSQSLTTRVRRYRTSQSVATS